MPNAILIFTPTGNASLNDTAATGNVALPNGDSSLLLQSVDTAGQVLYFKLGGAAVTAATTDTPIMPGDRLLVRKGPSDTYIAAITASSTASLKITSGHGG